MILKKFLWLLLGLSLAVGIEWFAWAQVPIRVGYTPTASAPGLFVARAKGLFEHPGIKLTWIKFVTPGHVIEAMAAGALDVGTVAGTQYLLAVDKGVPVVAPALLAGLDDPPVGFLVRREAGIDSVVDLKGKVVAVPSFSGTPYIYLRYMSEKFGLDWKKDLQVVEAPAPTILRLLLSKQVDAGAVPTLLIMQAKKQQGDKLKVLFDFADVQKAAGKKIMNSMLLAMRKDFVVKNREAAMTFLKGYLEGVKAYKADLAGAIEILVEVSGVPLMKEVGMVQVPEDGRIDADWMQFDLDLLYKFNLLKKRYRATELLDFSLLDEALKK